MLLVGGNEDTSSSVGGEELGVGRGKNRCVNNPPSVFTPAIATSKVDDVRTVLDYYRSEDDVVEAFKRNQAKLREQQVILNQKQKEQGGQWGGLFGRKLFGGGQSSQVRSLINLIRFFNNFLFNC